MKNNINQKIESFVSKLNSNSNWIKNFITLSSSFIGFDNEEGNAIIMISIAMQDSLVVLNGSMDNNTGQINFAFSIPNHTEYFKLKCNKKNITKKIGYSIGYIIKKRKIHERI